MFKDKSPSSESCSEWYASSRNSRFRIEESPNGDAQDSKENQKIKFDETKDKNIRLKFDETKDKNKKRFRSSRCKEKQDKVERKMILESSRCSRMKWSPYKRMFWKVEEHGKELIEAQDPNERRLKCDENKEKNYEKDEWAERNVLESQRSC